MYGEAYPRPGSWKPAGRPRRARSRTAGIGAVVSTLLVAVLLITGCGRAATQAPDGPGGGAQVWSPPNAEAARLVAGSVGGLGFDVLQGLAEGAPDQNVILSPVSLAAVLAMLHSGAAGETADAIAQVLHVPGVDRDTLAETLAHVLRFFQTGDSDVELSVANALWAGEDAGFATEYVDRLRDVFAAEVRQQDLGDPGTAEAIDAWVREQTRDRIEGIARDLGLPNPDAVLVLLNAVYFKGQWTEPFDPRRTYPGSFHLADGTTIEVPMMMRDDMILNARGDGFTLVRLPYGDSERFAFDIVLPDPGRDLTGLYAGFDVDAWMRAAGDLEASRVMLRVPRFELEYSTEGDLDRVLQQLGMEIVYSGAADFSPMGGPAFQLDSVVQKTFIRVDEEGTEAAAVTGGIGVTSLPPEIAVDRPFLFLISDTETGIILFMGQVTDPR